MTTLAELMTPLTRAEVEDSIYAAIEARGVGTTTWKAGSVTRTIITAVALVLSALSYLTAEVAKMGFLEYSSGDWLTLVARHVYGVERITGTFAAGNVLLDNTGGGVFAFGAGEVVVKSTATGKTYRNVEAFSLAAGQLGLLVAVEAVELGTGSTAPPATIDDFETILIGVTVTNPGALVGLDEESDEALRLRCRAKLGSLSPNGPWDAYYYQARSAVTSDDSTPAGVTRVATVPDGTGGVDVYVATPSGTITGTVGDTTTALGAVDEAIQTQVVPLAITATVQNATPVNVDTFYEVWVKEAIGIPIADLQTAIDQAITQHIGEVPIGGLRKTAGLPYGFLYAESVEAAIAETVGSDYLVDLVFDFPAIDGDDVTLDVDEAPVLSSIEATINMVGS